MRKPRPQDFDPNYKASKSLKPDQIELSGTVPIKHRSTEKEEIKFNRSDNRTEIRSEFRTPQLPIKRRTKRYSFEFYDDQLQQIRQLKIKTEMNGDSVTMSEIVRQAIDQYLNNK